MHTNVADGIAKVIKHGDLSRETTSPAYFNISKNNAWSNLSKGDSWMVMSELRDEASIPLYRFETQQIKS